MTLAASSTEYASRCSKGCAALAAVMCFSSPFTSCRASRPFLRRIQATRRYRVRSSMTQSIKIMLVARSLRRCRDSKFDRLVIQRAHAELRAAGPSVTGPQAATPPGTSRWLGRRRIHGGQYPRFTIRLLQVCGYALIGLRHFARFGSRTSGNRNLSPIYGTVLALLVLTVVSTLLSTELCLVCPFEVTPVMRRGHAPRRLCRPITCRVMGLPATLWRR